MSERPREHRFAASTLAATAWLIAFAPERLADWLEKHSNGASLETETRRLMAVKAARRKAGKEQESIS